MDTLGFPKRAFFSGHGGAVDKEVRPRGVVRDAVFKSFR